MRQARPVRPHFVRKGCNRTREIALTMGVRPCVTAKLLVLRPWFWNLILLNLAAASCYFIASLGGRVRCHWKMQNVKLLVCPTPAGCICSNSGNLLGRSAKHRKLQRCVAAQQAMLRACCVCVAYDKTHATLQIVDKLLLHSKLRAKPPKDCEFRRQPKNRAKKSKRNVDVFFCLSRNIKSFSKHEVPPYSRQRSFQSQDFETSDPTRKAPPNATPTPCPATN